MKNKCYHFYKTKWEILHQNFDFAAMFKKALPRELLQSSKRKKKLHFIRLLEMWAVFHWHVHH